MDNLFNLVKLAHAVYSLPKPNLVHSFLRKSSHGCPWCVVQEDKVGRLAKVAKGTVKVAVLKGDSMSLDLVITSCFDQKPFYMISSKCKKVSWEPVTKKNWSSRLTLVSSFVPSPMITTIR
jgi:hypothetical protein